MSTSTVDRPKFTVLDIVISLEPEDGSGEGIVTEIRQYVDGAHTFSVAPVDETNEEMGGIYSGAQLAATGRRASINHFWRDPQRARQIVTITEDHPNPKLRGLFGVITDEVESGETETYTVALTSAKGRKHKTRYRDTPARFLKSTGHRLPPEPVPRPIRTFRPGRDQHNLWPSHEFDIIDELDQYL
jgi:hypothetical protein